MEYSYSYSRRILLKAHDQMERRIIKSYQSQTNTMRNFVIKLSQKPLVISGPSAAGKVSEAFGLGFSLFG